MKNSVARHASEALIAGISVAVLVSLVAGWALAAEPAHPPTDEKAERAPCRRVCEQDAQGRIIRCRELQQ